MDNSIELIKKSDAETYSVLEAQEQQVDRQYSPHSIYHLIVNKIRVVALYKSNMERTMYLYLLIHGEIVETIVPVLAYLIRPNQSGIWGIWMPAASKSAPSCPLFHLSSFSGSHSLLSPLYEHVSLDLDLIFNTPVRRFRSGAYRRKWGAIYYQLRLN
jgi:hypothetical protein